MSLGTATVASFHLCIYILAFSRDSIWIPAPCQQLQCSVARSDLPLILKK